MNTVNVDTGLTQPARRCSHWPVFLFREFGSGNVFRSKGEAIAAIFEKLDRERCRHCDKRIFSECTAVEYVGLPHESARWSRGLSPLPSR